MYLPETIRDAIISRIEAVSTAHASFYRSPAEEYDSYPAYVLEYAENTNVWSASSSDKKIFMFNLYIAYTHTNDETTRNLAEKSISDAIGELYKTVFSDPDTLSLANGWLRASDVSWGYGTNNDIPMRIALMQIEVTVHEDR
ncbi:MAG: hypothetical protein KAS07_02850 [Candidatus Pacebacteria bacterium]|nr:hypothetical protein [Candidatus Paceibacterota bacterium]